MAVIEGSTGIVVEADGYQDSHRVSLHPVGAGYKTSGITGPIGAALGANSSVFAMRLDPGAAVDARIHRLRIQFTCIVAFTVPITTGRRLALFRGSGAATTGGTGITTAVPADTGDPLSEFNVAQGGDIRISTTAALGVAGITYETDPMGICSLIHVGAAGAHIEWLWEPNETEGGAPLVLNPGQLLAIRNPIAMDAAGTWVIAVNVHWTEQASL